MKEDSYISIATYHEYITAAYDMLYEGLQHQDLANQVTSSATHEYWQHFLLARNLSGYSFLLIANSVEAAANALILEVAPWHEYLQLEKKPTLEKFDLYCKSRGKTLDRGNKKTALVNEIIQCRNEFVHPKPRKVKYEFNHATKELEFEIRRTQKRKYPHYFSEMKPQQVVDALGDVLNFLGWLCCDVCELSKSDAGFALGIGSCGRTGVIDLIMEKCEVQFDTRSLGI